MLNCNLFSNYSITRCRLNLVKKNVTLYRTTDHWWLDQAVKKLIAFRSRKVFAYHSKPSVLSVTWCAQKKKKSYVGPHDFRSFILYDLFYWLNSLSERDTSLLLRETIMCLMSIWYIVFHCTMSQVLKGDHWLHHCKHGTTIFFPITIVF